MTDFRSPRFHELPHIPDDLTIPQFIFDYRSPEKPVRPDHVPFFIDDHTGRPVFERQLHKRTCDLANGLATKFQMKDGDVACLFSSNDMDYATIIWAVQLIGGVITPTNPSYTVDELVHQLEVSEASLIVVHSQFLPTALAAAKIAGIPRDRVISLHRVPNITAVTVDDLVELGSKHGSTVAPKRLQPGEAKTKLAFLSFSSGTTGKAKAVAISHYAVIANVIQTLGHHGVVDPAVKENLFAPGDVALGVLPFFHIYGLVYTLHVILYCGMSLVVVPKFNFTQFLNSIVRHRGTHVFVVPPQVVLLTKASLEQYDFRHIKYCMSGAAPLSGELMCKLQNVFPNSIISSGYGLTEFAGSVSHVPLGQKVGTVDSAGQLIPGVTARVVRPDGSLANEGEEGELILTGPSVALCYYKNPEATKEAFIDGWVRTGDKVLIKNAEVFILDRLKEIIKVRGFQVAPAELEGHLLLRSDVSDACVVSILDDYSGELPLAFVVPSPAIKARIAEDPAEAKKYVESLMKYVADTKVAYKRLAGGVEIVDSIPKNTSGKILRRILRDQARAQRSGVKSKL